MEQHNSKIFHVRFGERIKRLRKERGYSQNEFADASGITQAYLSRVERGIANPQLENIKKIAECLGISLSDLFDFDVLDQTSVELRPEEKVQRLLAALQSLPTDISAEIYDTLSIQIKRK